MILGAIKANKLCISKYDQSLACEIWNFTRFQSIKNNS